MTRIASIVVFLLAAAPSLAGSRLPARAGAARIAPAPPIVDTLLRLARSGDGRIFTDLSETFLARAAAPDLLRLPDGTLLAIFEHASDPASAVCLAVSRSRDDGRSWSPVRAVQLKDARGRRVEARRPDLVLLPDHSLRLFFVTPADDSARSRRGKTDSPRVRSARSQNGHTFSLDDAIRWTMPADATPGAAAAWIGDRLHLYAPALPYVSESDEGAPEFKVRHSISRDGRRFIRLADLRLEHPPHTGNMVTIQATSDRDARLSSVLPSQSPQGDSAPKNDVERTAAARPYLRAYVTGEGGIRSLTSTDGRAWKQEEGLCLPNGWDPAVIELKDGSFLMLHAARRGADPSKAPSLVDASGELHPTDDAVWPEGEGINDDVTEYDTNELNTGELAASDPQVTLNVPPDSSIESAADPSGETRESDSLGGADEPSPSEAGPQSESRSGTSSNSSAEQNLPAADAAASPGAQQSGARGPDAESDGFETVDDWLNGLVAFDTDGFAPKPDFRKPMDYFQWWKEFARDRTGDNAYDAYADFMMDPANPLERHPDWPEFRNMHEDQEYVGPPRPWDPDDHPDWESSSRAAQDILNRFREAAKHKGYATPAQLTPDSCCGDRLFGLLLPNLSLHRQLAKAALADSWRAENGRVSAERMTDAWETVLRNANHMSQGATLIEELVGLAERNLVHTHARWALKQEVLAPDDVNRGLDILRQFGPRDDVDPMHVLRGEHAVVMDAVQHLFSPPDPDGTPRINTQQTQMLREFAGIEDDFGERARSVADMTPQDAVATIDALDTYYRELGEQMRLGYPDARAVDLDETTERYLHTSPLTEMFLPSLSRVHTLRTRGLATARATRLAYATHAFRAQHNRWPASLDELPAETAADMRTDPFTGRDFGYRLTDDGPTIYSASENGIDDGGVHSPRWNDRIENDAGSDDYVFWPPQE